MLSWYQLLSLVAGLTLFSEISAKSTAGSKFFPRRRRSIHSLDLDRTVELSGDSDYLQSIRPDSAGVLKAHRNLRGTTEDSDDLKIHSYEDRHGTVGHCGDSDLNQRETATDSHHAHCHHCCHNHRHGITKNCHVCECRHLDGPPKNNAGLDCSHKVRHRTVRRCKHSNCSCKSAKPCCCHTKCIPTTKKPKLGKCSKKRAESCCKRMHTEPSASKGIFNLYRPADSTEKNLKKPDNEAQFGDRSLRKTY